METTNKKSAHKTGVPTLESCAICVEVRTSKAGSAAEFNCHRQVVAAPVLQASSDAIGRAETIGTTIPVVGEQGLVRVHTLQPNESLQLT